MKISGTHTIDLPTDRVWKTILDRAILEEVTPGVSELVEEAPNQYKAISEIKMGPVKGSFKGKLKVKEVEEPNSFVLSIAQDSSIGSANADIKVELSEAGEQTQVKYNGDAKLTGVLGRLGQRVLGGVVHSLARQFFTEYEKKVKSVESGN